MKKLLIVCGPTAVGKTKLGIKLAKQFNGEIVSADSRQIYIGMDIGTGKDVERAKSKEQREKLQREIRKAVKERVEIGIYEAEGVPIWMLDIVEPDQKFSVSQYQFIARKVINNIWERGNLPIVVGGAGLYIKSLIANIETINISPDWKLRKRLNKLPTKQLQEYLREICPERLKKMNKSDSNNPRRLVRAIEIGIKAQSAKRKIKNNNEKFKIDKLLIIGLKTKDYQALYQRIDERVENRIKQGAQKEAEKLFEKYTWENSILSFTIGYKQWRDFFRPKDDQPMAEKTKNEVIKKWKFAEHSYARRQMTWFKKMKDIHWFDIDGKDWQKTVAKTIKKWYSKR